MSRVEWTRRKPDEIEEVLSIMLCRRHPNAQHVRPGRGDGGIDVFVPTSAGRVVYQIKSFTEGLTASHKRQIKDSWERFLKTVEDEHLTIAAWHLIRPIDPTPGETQWLDELTSDAPFECSWRGLAFCDGLAAEFPDVVDYYLFDGKERLNETVALLSSIIAGKAQLDSQGHLDASGSYSTLESLHEALNRFDPHFRYDFAVTTIQPGVLPPVSITPGLVAAATRVTGDRAITFHIHAKYLQAADDRPVPGSFTLTVVPETPEAEAWNDFIRFGLPIDQLAVSELNIDLPGGLGTTASEGFIRVGPSRHEFAKPFDLTVTILSPDETTVAETVVHMNPATTGLDGKGIAVSGVAHGGAFELSLKIRLDGDTFRLNLKERDLAGSSPADVLPGVRVLAALNPNNRVVFSVLGQRLMAPAQLPESMLAQEEAADVLAACEALAAIQHHAVCPVTIPDLSEVTVKEANKWLEAARLLDGEKIEGTWDGIELTLNPDADVDALREPHTVAFDGPFVLVVGNQHVPLGMQRVHLATAKMVSCNLYAGTARLEPADNNRVTTSLLSG
jgi:hypothetical protein